MSGSVGVVGGGRMGAGIAHAFLVAGFEVIVVETDPGRVEFAEQAVIRSVDKSARHGSLDRPAKDVTSRLIVVDEIMAVRDVDLVIEAVPEISDIKRGVLRSVAATVATDVPIASNTSSMSITALAEHVRSPGRFLGMHFFNPVPASQLVEIVLGRETSKAIATRVQSIVTSLGKIGITVKDSPGFASSRLGVLLGMEAIRMVEERVASAADIDLAMTLGYKHPMGPLRVTDLVGLDTRLDIATYLSAHLGDRFSPPRLLREMVERGELGRKSGRGFYDWSEQG